MKQVVISRHGGPEVLRVQEAADPLPGPGEIRIRVKATGVNFADVMARLGLYPDAPPPPCVVGYEVAGVVDTVGEGVQRFREGARVAALTRFGGYSDVVVVPEEQVIAIPEGKDFVEAAALPVNYLTAFLMVERLAALRAGERILIHGAAGGVGLAALQIAKALGAETYGTASGAKHEKLRSMGLDHPIDYQRVDFEKAVRELTKGKGVDVVLDPMGGSSIRKSYRLLTPMGRLLLFGVSGMSRGKRRSFFQSLRNLLEMPFFHPVSLMNQNRAVFGVNLGRLWGEKEKVRAMFEEVARRWEAGDLTPVIDTTFPLERAGAAHDRLQDRLNFGKVVLVP